MITKKHPSLRCGKFTWTLRKWRMFHTKEGMNKLFADQWNTRSCWTVFSEEPGSCESQFQPETRHNTAMALDAKCTVWLHLNKLTNFTLLNLNIRSIQCVFPGSGFVIPQFLSVHSYLEINALLHHFVSMSVRACASVAVGRQIAAGDAWTPTWHWHTCLKCHY